MIIFWSILHFAYSSRAQIIICLLSSYNKQILKCKQHHSSEKKQKQNKTKQKKNIKELKQK